MKNRFSKITRGFALAGFIIPLLIFTVTLIDSRYPDSQVFVYIPVILLVYLCPPMSFLLGLESSGTTAAFIFAHVTVVLSNTILYGIIGLAVSRIYQLINRSIRLEPKPR